MGKAGSTNVGRVSNLTRSQREKRAYQLTIASGGGGLATVVVFLLMIVGHAGFGLFLLLALFTAACVYGLRRVTGS